MDAKILKKRKKSCFEPHDHEKCVTNALFVAEELCKARNLRLTDLRFADFDFFALQPVRFRTRQSLNRFALIVNQHGAPPVKS